MEILRSEHTKNMTEKEIETLQEKIKAMTPEELKRFRNSHDPDCMGHCGKECI